MSIFGDLGRTASDAVSSLENKADHALTGIESAAASAGARLSDEVNSLKPVVAKAAGAVAEGAIGAVSTIGKYEGKAEHQFELFGEGVVTGAVLNPINGVGQIINKVADTHLPALEFSNQAEVNASIAGKIGMVAGTAADFVLTDGAVSAVGGIEAGSALSLAVTGAIDGGIFTPSSDNKSGLSFLADRLENAAIGGATAAVMGGVAGKLDGFYDPAASLVRRMLVAGATNAVGGAVGGAVTAEGNAILKEGRLATASELGQSVAYGTLMGGAFGAGMVGLEAGVQSYLGQVKPGDDVQARLNRGFDDSHELAKRIEVKSDVSQGFVNRVAGAIDNLPDDVKAILKDVDVRVKVGARVTDIDPSLDGQTPRGYDDGTWREVDGFYSSDGYAAVSEYFEDGGKLARSTRTPGVTRHEIGHGIDEFLTVYSAEDGDFSQSPAFHSAWEADVAHLSEADKARLDYYIQEDEPFAGQGEAFADIFASLTGGATNASETNYILNSFPRATAVVKEKLANMPAPRIQP